MNKVITRIKGGVGNQLFCYAAARRLALVNNAELVIDDVTGFARDRQYRRKYMLDRFSIPFRKATSAERLEPFERYRRGIMKWLSRRKPFAERRYLEQEGIDIDERLLAWAGLPETLDSASLLRVVRHYGNRNRVLRFLQVWAGVKKRGETPLSRR